ncbi:DUF3313 domain-containing protein [Bordetella genomosp. 11]|uniref:DUF3313 domain-containing protein n=1 Tax=Bordetella genomosp. 11 TaxID=1416808 RepID=A0A261UNA3_9BORD|nr:DUF3313 domain-containing protein [Bordetella genomosp. 11]OZI63349.1 hypothetical protein CAL28_14055 [Bordetella genomosp. 11]
MGTFKAVGIGVAMMAMVGCTSAPPKESGFLGNEYSKMHQTEAPDGGRRLSYLNPRFTPANYNALLLEPVVYYPEPQPTEKVSMATLDQIRTYADTSLRQKLGQQVRLVEKPGPGVARVRVAVTAVGSENQPLAFYQYIPVALLVTGAKAAIEGGRPQDATIAIETSITDSMTNETLYAAVRGGAGKEITESGTEGETGVRLQNVEALIDTWTTGAAQEIVKYVAAR